MALNCSGNYKQIWCYHGHQHSRHYQLWHRMSRNSLFSITCKLCVEDLFILLPDLLLVVFKQPLTQVAHLLQCKRWLVLSWGTWQTETQLICEDADSHLAAVTGQDHTKVKHNQCGPKGSFLNPIQGLYQALYSRQRRDKNSLNTKIEEGLKILQFAFQVIVTAQSITKPKKKKTGKCWLGVIRWGKYGMR